MVFVYGIKIVDEVKMDISVIIPVYNAPHELFDKCIESLLRQKGNYELLFVNDGSTDKWIEERINKAVSDDPRVRYIKKRHSGLCDTRNIGLAEAKGTYLTFVDADDVVLDGAFEQMLLYTIETGADVSIFGISTNYSHESIKKILSKSEIEDMIWACLAYRTSKYVKLGLIVDSTWARLYRKSIIDDNKLKFETTICKSEDAIFDVWFYQYANTIYIDNMPVYDYVFNPQSISHAYKYEYVEMIPLYLKAKDEFVDVFYGNNIRFRQAVAIRTVVALMDADHCYFSLFHPQKTFFQIAKEFRQLLNNPIIARNLKNVDFSLLNKNQLTGIVNKMKLFFYKKRMVEVDMLLFRMFHLIRK